MKVFLIHSYSDKDYIENYIEKFKKHNKLEFIKLERNYNLTWKLMSKRGITKSDFIIFVIGKDSHKSEPIKFELKYAKKTNKKIYIIKIGNNFKVPSEVEDIQAITEKELNNIIELEIDSSKKLDKALFNSETPETLDDESKKLLFEQYKLLLQTSETLITRRQTMNTFFLTANGVLISMLGLITSAKIESKYLFVYLCAFAVVGVLLCLSWRSLLVSYGQLNTGKFAVLNKLEHYLPVCIFSGEWIALGEGKDKRKYRSFTQSEKNVPILFLLVYIIFFITVIIFKVTIVKEFLKLFLTKLL